MTPLAVSILDEFRAILGPVRVISDENELRTYECDGLTNFRVCPRAVLLPESTRQTSAPSSRMRNTFSAWRAMSSVPM